jgi:hypothetical protein
MHVWTLPVILASLHGMPHGNHGFEYSGRGIDPSADVFTSAMSCLMEYILTLGVLLSCCRLQAMLQQLMQSGGLQQLMGGAGARMG